MANRTISVGGATTEKSAADFRIQDDTDDTKEIAFDASGITTGTTRTVTVPDEDVDLGNLGGEDIVWTNVASFTTASTDDWPEFTSVPDADLYRLRIIPPVTGRPQSGGLLRAVTLNFDGDTTSGHYYSNTSSDTKMLVGLIGQGGHGFTTAILRRVELNSMGDAIVCHSVGAGWVSAGIGNRNTYIAAHGPGSRPTLGTWTFGITGTAAWCAGITFYIDTGVDP